MSDAIITAAPISKDEQDMASAIYIGMVVACHDRTASCLDGHTRVDLGAPSSMLVCMKQQAELAAHRYFNP